MALRDDGKVYIEAGVNEVASKDDNPHVPYGAEESAKAVAQSHAAGATVVHFHARYADGVQAWVDDEVSRDVLRSAAASGDVLAYPSYHGSLEHVWALAQNPVPGVPLELAPFDPAQHIKRVLWVEEEQRFGVVTFGPDDPNHGRPPHPPEIDRFRELGLVPNIAIFNASDLRWVVLAARAGLFSQPLNLKFFFSDRWVSNSDPDPEVLDFLLSRIPTDIDHESLVVPYAMSSPERCEALWTRALERGLGIRVGIGDCPLAFPTATNRELVERAVQLVQSHGLEPASSDDLRRRCGLPLRVGAGQRGSS